MRDQETFTRRCHIVKALRPQLTWEVLHLDRPISLNLNHNINTSHSRRRDSTRPHLTNQADHGPVEDHHPEVIPEAILGEPTTTWENLCIRICTAYLNTWSTSHLHRDMEGPTQISKVVKMSVTKNNDPPRSNKSTGDQLIIKKPQQKNQSVSWRSS